MMQSLPQNAHSLGLRLARLGGACISPTWCGGSWKSTKPLRVKARQIRPVDNFPSASTNKNAQKTSNVDKCCRWLICLNIPVNVLKLTHKRTIYDGCYVK